MRSPVQSMTGFGRREVRIGDSVVTAEIKTLNSKFFDANFKLPQELKFKEIEIRQMLSRILVRGKVECYIHLGGLGETSAGQLNQSLLRHYLVQLKEFFEKEAVLVEDKDIVPHLVRLPDVFGGDDEFWSEHWKEISGAIEAAAEAAVAFREKEGAHLAEDLEDHVGKIVALREQIEPHEKVRLEALRDRLTEQFEKLNSKDRDRFEQEMIYYLERLDISEEKTRLAAHCKHFTEVLQDDNKAKGKRLNFVSQEMGREINTLGSKANHAPIQRIVILMKDELEKVKEQILNIL